MLFQVTELSTGALITIEQPSMPTLVSNEEERIVIGVVEQAIGYNFDNKWFNCKLHTINLLTI
jgi:hypothetical protein